MEKFSEKYQLPLVDVHCDICGSKSFDYLNKIRSLHIVRCCECEFIYTNPRLIYDYKKNKNSILERVDEYEKYYYDITKIDYLKFLKKVKPNNTNNRLLDFGSGLGHFLGLAKEEGWDSFGFEIDSDAAKWSANNFQIEIFRNQSEVKSLYNQFDVITLWDVIEHIENPEKVIEFCYDLLKPGGILYIKTPNAIGLEIKKKIFNIFPLFIYWNLVYPAMPYEHIYHFKLEDIKKILSSFNLKIFNYNEIHFNKKNYIGRNGFIKIFRNFFGRISNLLLMPYEMEIYAKKK